MLLLLELDMATDASLRSMIRKAVTALWPICVTHLVSSSCGASQHLTYQSPLQLAERLCSVASGYSSAVQAALVSAVGEVSHESRRIVVWIGIGLLLPGCLNELQHVSPSLPIGGD